MSALSSKNYCWIAKLVAIFTLLTDGSAFDSGFAKEPILTRWADSVSAESVWPEYPRPQMTRQSWLNLNGEWELTIDDNRDEWPTAYGSKILVPFPLESYLGGARKQLLPEQTAWYRRNFDLPSGWQGKQLLLHFGAVDWHAQVWVNGSKVGEHRGGYDPFSFEISENVQADQPNEIVVAVVDPTDSGSQPCGKQRLNPQGIWYTQSSGIWQTVWLEPVADSYVQGLKITPSLEDSTLEVVVAASGVNRAQIVVVEAKVADQVVASAQGDCDKPIRLQIDNPHAWSPSDPFLYDLEVRLMDGSHAVDQVSSYFGMRSIKLGTDKNGLMRMLFNGEPYFQYGPLDQGYWPDGLYTAPSDEAMRYDLEMTKRLGFNMVRKHVKVEPARWYYWCDRLGLLVWQDMPNGGEHAEWPRDGVETQRSAESSEIYYGELKAMIDAVGNSPAVVVWVPFNEGWGQFETKQVTEWLKTYDPNRLVVSASGGNDFACGDINDDHFYPGPGAPPAEKARAAVLGEFGGLGMPLEGHTWQQKKNWGYRSFTTSEQLTAAYLELIAKLRPLVESHLSAAIYTQTTDVEIEVNGLLSYDRQVLKLDEAAVLAANESLNQPLPNSTEAEQVASSALVWWRFEDGKDGVAVADLSKRMGAIAARDFSGHSNHLFAYSPRNAPAISTTVPKRQMGLTDSGSHFCLDDTLLPSEGAATRDLYTNPEVAQTHMDKLDHFPFTDWTIEASFCLSTLKGQQVALAKEETLDGRIQPLFQLGAFGNPPCIGVELVDQSNQTIALHSDIIAKPDQWWHVAVSCRDSKLQLFVAKDKNSAEFKLVAEAVAEGSLARRGGTWVVGRGVEAGNMGQDFHGLIDEIRISTKALKPTQFLFGKPN